MHIYTTYGNHGAGRYIFSGKTEKKDVPEVERQRKKASKSYSILF